MDLCVIWDIGQKWGSDIKTYQKNELTANISIFAKSLTLLSVWGQELFRAIVIFVSRGVFLEVTNEMFILSEHVHLTPNINKVVVVYVIWKRPLKHQFTWIFKNLISKLMNFNFLRREFSILSTLSWLTDTARSRRGPWTWLESTKYRTRVVKKCHSQENLYLVDIP